MSNPHYARDFGSFDGRIWLNCAHQGPLPRVAVEAAEEALHWKVSPHHLDEGAFFNVPQRLKEALGKEPNVRHLPYSVIRIRIGILRFMKH